MWQRLLAPTILRAKMQRGHRYGRYPEHHFLKVPTSIGEAGQRIYHWRTEALDFLAHGKVRWKDGISVEVLKYCKGTLIAELHEIFCLCWKEGEVLQDTRDVNIITLYKSKGNMSDGNNYQGISVLRIVGKLFDQVALKRLQVLAEKVYPESQCEFRASRSTIDMVFSLRQLLEKCRE